MPILVVDDDEDLARLLALRLQLVGGYEVSVAHSAAAAFERLGIQGTESAATIDLILMDVELPGINGIEACRRLKSHSLGQDIPVIMMTGHDDQGSLEAAFEAGAVDYVTKPFDNASLMARVRSALRLKEEIGVRKQREQELLDLTRRLEMANEQLRQLTSLDDLTGIANRRQFEVTIHQEFQRAMRNKTALSLIMIDIDNFKVYNDIYGHQTGDNCLRRVAAALDSVLKRPNDLLARYGGEEFAVILPETSSKGASNIAESLRQAVEILKIPHSYASQNNLRVTVSLGVATLIPQRGDEPTKLISVADQALYQSKHAGRNQVSVAGI
ncbi:GGDEF domain-containing response regulator [Nitrosococcus watsonii]|uniref:diguanylate cyclase n=1 Tax=Nitrosococcus watsoni (strain C-113) TaxID=105559 RepID=D8K8G9_NITWC|nr:diguanylate cyclase [Nitrosococcus watsonii]ADJ29089.1 response regulator receiver modulated diguanylate cyclase [Nitrosococcus watsonii C-113]